MQTLCPHCETLFDIKQQQLQQASGLVVCGACEKTFNARHHMLPGQKSLFTAGDSRMDASSVDRIRDKMARIPSVLREDMQAQVQDDSGSRWSRLLRIAVVMSLLCLLPGQVIFFNLDAWGQKPEWRPYLVQMCRYLYCQLAELHDPAAIKLVSQNVYTHPNIEGVLIISATLVNHAPFPQSYPVIGLQLSDLQGKITAARYFNPDEYLRDIDVQGLMIPQTPVSTILEIIEPAQHVFSYEFKFF